MLKILLECTKNMFAQKGLEQEKASGSKLGREESRQRRGGARQRYRTSICLYQRNILKENKAPAFLRRRKSDCREVGVRRGRLRSSEKREGQRTVRASLRTEKRRQRALNAALPLLDTTKNSAPPPPKLLHSFVAKAQKGKGSTFVFALGSSALPLVIDEAF